MTETTEDLLARLAGFTPGVWLLDPSNDESSCGKEAVILRRGFYIAVLPGGYLKADADAQLIAAAPDLHRIATDQAAEIARLRVALSAITATDCYSRDEVTAMARAALKVQS